MAQVTFLHYIQKDTVLHRMDGRLKLLGMVLLSLSVSFASELRHYLLLTGVIVVALAISKLPISALLKDMRLFVWIILIVLIADAFNIPGDPIPGCPIVGISIQGVVEGLRFGARLILILLVCTIMTGTTSLLTFRNVIEWYLRPIPLVPAARVATMINLTFVLMPLIFDSYSEMMHAQNSRCVQLRRNPIKRIGFIVFPLLSRTLQRADEMVFAMEARCYAEERTRPVFTASRADWLICAICLTVLLFVALL